MKRSLASGLLLTALAVPSPATRVVAVSDEVSLTPPDEGLTYVLRSPDVTATAPGEFVVAWSANSTLYQGSHPVGVRGGLLGRKVGLDAQPLAPELPIVPIGDTLDAESPRFAGNASGRFVVAWEQTVTTGRDFENFRSRSFFTGARSAPMPRPREPRSRSMPHARGGASWGLAPTARSPWTPPAARSPPGCSRSTFPAGARFTR